MSIIRKRIVVIIAAFVLMITGTSATTPEYMGVGENAHNQCTTVPDLYFTIPCDDHDRCYYRKARKVCDQEFLADMLAICRQLPPLHEGICRIAAGSYFVGVRLFGHPGYELAQAQIN